MRIDIQVKLHDLARQFMLGGEIMIPPVVELDLSEVLARYLVHIFNIVLQNRPVPAFARFYPVPRPAQASAAGTLGGCKPLPPPSPAPVNSMTAE